MGALIGGLEWHEVQRFARSCDTAQGSPSPDVPPSGLPDPVPLPEDPVVPPGGMPPSGAPGPDSVVHDPSGSPAFTHASRTAVSEAGGIAPGGMGEAALRMRSTESAAFVREPSLRAADAKSARDTSAMGAPRGGSE